jgi:hypothetical protein
MDNPIINVEAIVNFIFLNAPNCTPSFFNKIRHKEEQYKIEKSPAPIDGLFIGNSAYSNPNTNALDNRPIENRDLWVKDSISVPIHIKINNDVNAKDQSLTATKWVINRHHSKS